MMQPSESPPTSLIYEISVHEDLDDGSAAWFGPLTVRHAVNGATVLTVAVRDQTELHSLLIKIRDLNLTIIAIVSI